MEEKQLEKLMERCLELQDQGRSTAEVFAEHPEAKEELTEMLALLAWIDEEKKSITPSRDLFTRIIKTLPLPTPPAVQAPAVTARQSNRYGGDGHDGVRRPIESPITTNIPSQSVVRMNSAFRIWFPVGVFAVLALLIGVNRFGGTEIAELPTATETAVVAVPPTGNIDDVLAFLDEEFDAETSILAQADEDMQLANDNSEAINEFGQTYDENEF